jgi:hypothetical protein
MDSLLIHPLVVCPSFYLLPIASFTLDLFPFILRAFHGREGVETMRLVWVLIFLIASCTVWSHALDPRSIDRYAEIILSPERGRVYYVLVYGQNGSEFARDMLQPDPLGLAPIDRQQAYLAQRNDQYAPGQTLEINSQPVPLQYVGGASGMVIGHGGAEVNRAVLIYEFGYPADMVRDATVPCRYEDTNFVRLFAWKQIRVLGLQGVQVDGHIPYENLIPYDYTNLDLAGFLPSTRSVQLDIFVPAQPVDGATPAVSYVDALMKFGWPPPPPIETQLLKKVIVVGISITLLVGGIAVVVSRRRAHA